MPLDLFFTFRRKNRKVRRPTSGYVNEEGSFSLDRMIVFQFKVMAYCSHNNSKYKRIDY